MNDPSRICRVENAYAFDKDATEYEFGPSGKVQARRFAKKKKRERKNIKGNKEVENKTAFGYFENNIEINQNRNFH